MGGMFSAPPPSPTAAVAGTGRRSGGGAAHVGRATAPGTRWNDCDLGPGHSAAVHGPP